jgi:hypothetical protein
MTKSIQHRMYTNRIFNFVNIMFTKLIESNLFEAGGEGCRIIDMTSVLPQSRVKTPSKFILVVTP